MSQKHSNISGKFSKLKHLAKKVKELLKCQSRGAILIIVAIFIPLMLYGTKLVLDHRTKLDVLQEVGKANVSDYSKRCAKEAALAVAQNWNPGLTLGQQKEGVYKVADAVYNANPCYSNSVIGSAIPGLDVKSSYKVIKKGKYNPVDVSYTVAAPKKTVSYSDVTKYICRWYNCSYASSSYGWNRYYGMWLGIDKASEPTNRRSMFDEIDQTKINSAEYILQQHEICVEPHVYGCIVGKTPTDIDYDSSWHNVYYNMPSTSTAYSGLSGYSFYTNLNQYKSVSSYTLKTDILVSTLSTTTYTQRSTGTDANYVKISIASDSTNGGKIQVQTDSDVGYAIPASCNVDIVLAVPVNGAACNANGRDLASDTAENPLSYTSSATFPATAKNTPIYQMGQALKNFVKDNFYHTRGVYMSLIPYSGKLSISPDRAVDWTVSIPQFDDSSTNLQKIIGACLYGTQGQKGAKLKRDNITTTIKTGTTITAPYYWGGLQQGCPIMCRQGSSTTYSSYGNNYAASGLLLNTSSPSTSNNYRYRRMNLNPCYMGYANTLSMRCEKTCRYYAANPYYIIEPTADLVKIYEMCNALTPVYDEYNVSNFVFLPLEWANNFFQSWTRNQAVSTAVTGTSSTATLTCPSKTTSGRKKAVILLVNKPDWFEPGELTYLGFDNDYSEIPMTESDCIRFDINYSDTNKKFADGSAYDGTVQGQKKILKFSGNFSRNSNSGYYECSSGSATLTFPKKYLLKVVVEPMEIETGWVEQSTPTFEAIQNRQYNHCSLSSGFVNNVNNRLMAVSLSGYVGYSDDGFNWSRVGSIDLDGGDYYVAPAYGNGIWVIFNKSGDFYTSSNGVSWSKQSVSNASAIGNANSLAFGNGVFMTGDNDGYVYTSQNGVTWTKKGRIPLTYPKILMWDLSKGRWIGGRSSLYESYDNGSTWSLLDSSLGNIYSDSSESANDSKVWMGITYAKGKYYAVHGSGATIAISSTGKNWSKMTSFSVNHWPRNITFYKNKLFSCDDYGTFAYIYSFPGSTIQFSGISSLSNGTTTSSYSLTGKKEFFIEPSQITGGSDGAYTITMSLENVRLISAEITNRPYKKITPTCSLSGTTDGTGTAYIYTNVKKPLTVNATQVIPNCSVTFSNCNNSNISNSGTHSITGNKAFSFPSSNFSNNYYKKKIVCSLNNTEITSASLVNQTYRLSNRTVDEGMTTDYWIGNDTWGQGSSIWCLNRDGYLKLSLANVTSSITANVYVERSIDPAVNWGTPDVYCYFFNELLGRTNRVKNENNNTVNLNITDKVLSSVDNNASFEIRSPSISGYTNCTNRIFVRTVNIKCNSNRSLNNGITLESGYICFYGIGDLSVTVRPVNTSSTIKYKNAEGTAVSLNIQNTQTLTIDPDNYKYEEQSNGYRIALDISNVKLSDWKLIDTSYEFEYTKIRLPYHSVSIDFSQKASGNKFLYNINQQTVQGTNDCLIYANDISGDISKMGVRWNDNISRWCFYKNSGGEKYDSNWHHFIMANNPGDMFFITDDMNYKIDVGTTCYHFYKNSDHLYNYLGSVLYKLFLPAENLHLKTDIGARLYCYAWEIYKSQNEIPLCMGGVTLPINAMLYYGAEGENLHAYQWQSDRNGDLRTYNTTEAVKNVAKDACKKLKSDWGDKLRIYLIKYRKQTQYKHKITQNTVNFDYSYLNDCATGTSTPYIYDVSTQNELESALSSIATDIKSWAGYTKAKNVE